MTTTVQKVEEKYLRKVPELKPGDTVLVHQKIKEGGKERTQVFEGVVLRVKGGGLRASFLVRQVFAGVGIEKSFPMHSPNITKIEVKKRAKVRQAYLSYLRNLRGKSARLRDKQFDTLAVNIELEPKEAESNSAKRSLSASGGLDKGVKAKKPSSDDQKTSNNDKKDAETTELNPEETEEPSADGSIDEVAKEEEKEAEKEDRGGRDEAGADHQETEAEETEEGLEHERKDDEKEKSHEGQRAEKTSEATTPEEIAEEIKEEKESD